MVDFCRPSDIHTGNYVFLVKCDNFFLLELNILESLCCHHLHLGKQFQVYTKSNRNSYQSMWSTNYAG